MRHLSLLSLALVAGLVGLACSSNSSSNDGADPGGPGDDRDASTDEPTSDAGDGGPSPGSGAKWAAVSLGGQHACALTASGKAYCWGFRANGGCGDGEAGNKELNWNEPHPVAGTHTFAKISAGADHTCAIDTNKRLYCWGLNHRGQIGDGGPTTGDEAFRFTPVQIRSDLMFVDVAAGQKHTCATDTAGKLYCWGDNASRQSGGPGSADVLVPAIVQGAGSQQFERVTAADTHSCALLLDGTGFCWGNGDLGNIGDGVMPAKPSSPTPTAIAGPKWSRIASELGHSCAIEKGTGDVYCWGDNSKSMLGVAPTTKELERTATPQKTGFKASEIAVLNGNTCALDPNGAAYCWGMDDGSGVIANGEKYGSSTVTHSAVPQPVTGGHTFVDLSARYGSMVCGTTTGGDIYCWGRATSARFLGDGDSTARNATPVKAPRP